MNYIQFLHQMHLNQYNQLEYRMNNVELALCNLFLILFGIGIGSLIVVKTVWEPMRKEGQSHYDDDDLKYESYLDKYPIHKYIQACQEFDDDDENDDDVTSGSEYDTSGDEDEDEDEESRGRNILIENTPEGTVFMNYNHVKEGFNYWSNTQIPFEYINTVARKYVITFDCAEFYVLSEKEKKLVDELQENDSEDEEDEEDKEEGEEEEGEEGGEDEEEEEGESENNPENQKEDKSEDDDYEKIIQSELEDVDKAAKNDEKGDEKETESSETESSEDESSEESSSEEEDEREKKLHNKIIYQGNIRNLDILNKKSFEKNNSKSFSFSDFLKMQSY